MAFLILLFSTLLVFLILLVFRRFRAWVRGRRLAEGIVGHSIVALAVLAVASGVYQVLTTEYKNEQVCADTSLEAVAHDLGTPESKPVLVHVRDGVGTAKEKEPLLIRYITMEHEGEKPCAHVTYARKLGFTFKIFVLDTKDVSDDDIHKRLEALRNEFAPQPYQSDPDGRCKTIKEITPRYYVTADKIPNGSWRIWFLLQDYICIEEQFPGMIFTRNAPQGASPKANPIEDVADQLRQLVDSMEGRRQEPIWNNFVQPSDDICLRSFLGLCIKSRTVQEMAH